MITIVMIMPSFGYLSIWTILERETPSWKLLQNGTVLERSSGEPPSWEGLFLDDKKYYFYKYFTVDTHTCLTLQLRDCGADGGMYLW